MMQHDAIITAPNDWTKEQVAEVLEAGLRAEVVIRWRKKHNKPHYAWPPDSAYNEVGVELAVDDDDSTLAMERADRRHADKVDPPEEEKQPKLDRQTRGQVRRVTNKLRTVERREFLSSSSNRTYETVIYADGQVLCNCQGWTIKKAGKARQCKHTAEMIGDREVIDNGEFQFLATLATAHHHKEI